VARVCSRIASDKVSSALSECTVSRQRLQLARCCCKFLGHFLGNLPEEVALQVIDVRARSDAGHGCPMEKRIIARLVQGRHIIQAARRDYARMGGNLKEKIASLAFHVRKRPCERETQASVDSIQKPVQFLAQSAQDARFGGINDISTIALSDSRRRLIVAST